MKSNRIQHPEFTDLAVVIGPDVRWVQDDYEDLQRYRPEVLLGYRVILATPGTFHRKTWGRWVTKFIVLDGTFRNPGWYRCHNDMYMTLERYPWARIEQWHVHRGDGVYQIA